MMRYKKANEGVHAPDDLKKQAVRSPTPRRRARWMGAVAAVLAATIVGGIVLWPGNGLTPAAHAYALAEAKYPEMVQYPKQEDYYTDETGDWDIDAFLEAEDAWRESKDALRSGSDFSAGALDGFLSRSTVQFLTGAGEENRVYSPLNTYMALAMLAETTGGNSRAQLLNLLGADSIESLRSDAAALWRGNYRDDGSVTSIMANSLWLRSGMRYSREVLDTLAKQYYASSFSGEMGSEGYDQALRDWLNEQTGGLLAEQTGELKMDPGTVLALASTLYFEARWCSEFNKDRTEADVFHAPVGDVQADFMRQTDFTGYWWGERFSAVALSFQNGGKMWLLLPDEEYSVDELLQSGEAMDFLLSKKHGRKDDPAVWHDQKELIVHLSLPRFDVSSGLDLIEGLKELGVTDVFDPAVSDFTPLEASTDDPLYVSQARHAARVTVDEEGCKATAYTVLMVEPQGGPPSDESVDFTLDRPFLFAITGDMDLPLFVGVVNQP